MKGMSQAAKAQEPSMEEILASIRRIIADDDASKAKAAEPAPAPKPAAAPPARPAAAAPRPVPPAPKPEPAPPPATNVQDDIDAMFATPEPEPEPEPELKNGAAQPDVLELTEAMEAPAEPPPTLRRIDGTSDVVYEETE